MREPTQEEIKELWGGCGFLVTENKSTDGHGGVTRYDDDYLYPNKHWGKAPKLDLNNLFKYAVPLVLYLIGKKGYPLPLMKLFQLWYGSLVSVAGGSNKTEYSGLALFWVCRSVITGKEISHE